MKKYIIIFIAIVIFCLSWYFLPKNFIINAPTIKILNSVIYVCDQRKNIGAEYYESDSRVVVAPGMPPVSNGSVKIYLSDGRKIILPQTISASGVRYANTDESFIFWNKGDEVMILENNQEKDYKNCVLKK
ncbi:MAG: MliC family protein [Candidatus Pacebacteria bacterium]|nr:MliC family protein [Candidatus Paceibacterota bacterium]